MKSLIDIFHSPSSVFEAEREKPRWWIPVVALVVLSLIGAALVVHVVGLSTLVRAQLESSSRIAEQLGPEKINEIVRQSDSPVRRATTYVTAAIGSVVTVLIIAAALMGLLQVVGGEVGFQQSISVTAYSLFVKSLIGTIGLAIVLAVMPDRSGIDVQNPMMLNLGPLVDRQTSRFLHSFLSSMDLLSFWAIYLMGLGYSKAGKGVTVTKALAPIVLLWLIWVIGMSAVSSLF